MRRFVRPCRHKNFNKTVAGSTTVRPEGEAGLVKPVPASVTAGSASALSACQIQFVRFVRPPLINKFNNKEGSDQIKLNLNKNNKDKGGCNATAL